MSVSLGGRGPDTQRGVSLSLASEAREGAVPPLRWAQRPQLWVWPSPEPTAPVHWLWHEKSALWAGFSDSGHPRSKSPVLLGEPSGGRGVCRPMERVAGDKWPSG